uniref:proline--tRNA ligase n=2 Tax=Nicotiana TaxID=4085 RepID=A0A1S3XHM8_TOBAC|nr:PREDICTED: proline--tRNA ligase-like [Nicotiana sylvestris]XP_016439431.1 PREDICTED: proline--tRNA ligase, cytoplasmic-like [Nicotiana tabacum]
MFKSSLFEIPEFIDEEPISHAVPPIVAGSTLGMDVGVVISCVNFSIGHWLRVTTELTKLARGCVLGRPRPLPLPFAMADTGVVLEILELYRHIYEEFLAVPVSKGKKSELEKFAGGLYTTTVEAFIPNTGRGIQGATSHCLGQNFAKMFEINFENEKGEKAMVWQNCWGFTTRTIGVMIMVHGDDKGLVLPPKVAATQVILIPVTYKDANTQGIFDACAATVKNLKESGIRAEADYRDNYSPGWKYSHWEMKGVPLRIEIGPKDLANNQVRAVRRDNGAKTDIPVANLVEEVNNVLASIQQNLFDVAKQKRDACVQVVKTWDEFAEAISQKKLILAPWCDEEDVEKDVKARTKGEMGAAKTLCSPFDQPELPEGTLCFASGKPAKKWTYWGRSY